MSGHTGQAATTGFDQTVPSRKTLYLMSQRRLSVRASAGSLAVYDGTVCRGRYPLARISRVLATRQVDWRGEALAACLKRRIGILFVDGHGTWYGSCEPALTAVSPITELLDEFVIDSDWNEVFDTFMRHLRSLALLRWVRKRGEARVSKAERATWMRCYVYHGEPPVALRYDFRGLLRGLVEARLHEIGVRTRYCREDGRDLDLAGEICGLVYGQIVMRAGSFQLQARNAESAVKFFEAALTDHHAAIDQALGALRRLLIRRSRQWH